MKLNDMTEDQVRLFKWRLVLKHATNQRAKNDALKAIIHLERKLRQNQNPKQDAAG